MHDADDFPGSAPPPRFFLYRATAVLVTLATFAAGNLSPIDFTRAFTGPLLVVASPTALAAGIIDGRGASRAFAIGGTFHFWPALVGSMCER
ncbi:MAG: hypothetical protein LLG00_12375 [Planctomycetaceae bacterium]|nr:hypothetical protein [Planctomycetaceae bacterium]